MVSCLISEKFTIDRFGESVHPVHVDSDRNDMSITFSQAYQTYHKEFIVGVKFELSFGKRLVKIVVQKVSIVYHQLTRIHRHHIGRLKRELDNLYTSLKMCVLSLVVRMTICESFFFPPTLILFDLKSATKQKWRGGLSTTTVPKRYCVLRKMTSRFLLA
ncbi:hypothetical protein EV1_005997 [Malus domestica]